MPLCVEDSSYEVPKGRLRVTGVYVEVLVTAGSQRCSSSLRFWLTFVRLKVVVTAELQLVTGQVNFTTLEVISYQHYISATSDDTSN